MFVLRTNVDSLLLYFLLLLLLLLPDPYLAWSRVCVCVFLYVNSQTNLKKHTFKTFFPSSFFVSWPQAVVFASSIISLNFSLVAFLFVEAFLLKKEKITTKTLLSFRSPYLHDTQTLLF